MDRLRELQGITQAQLLCCNNVVGVGIGPKRKRGRIVEDEAIVVLVRKKLDRRLVPRAAFVPRQIQDVPTDVVEVGAIRLLRAEDAPRTKKLRPARPGVSIGHYRITAGTLGCVVRDRRSGASLLLSNNHVLANMTDGEDGRAKSGDPILQPGRYDGGTDEDVLAVLERFVPIRRVNRRPSCKVAQGFEKVANVALRLFGPSYELRLERHAGLENLADAAVARPNEESDIDPEIIGLGMPKGTGSVAPGDSVSKSGRTTGVTHARVEVVHATVKVSLGDIGYGVFADQLVTSPLGDPGDSGSLVLRTDGVAVGLLAAGSDRVTICAQIDNVLSALDVDLAT